MESPVGIAPTRTGLQSVTAAWPKAHVGVDRSWARPFYELGATQHTTLRPCRREQVARIERAYHGLGSRRRTLRPHLQLLRRALSDRRDSNPRTRLGKPGPDLQDDRTRAGTGDRTRADNAWKARWHHAYPQRAGDRDRTCLGPFTERQHHQIASPARRSPCRELNSDDLRTGEGAVRQTGARRSSSDLVELSGIEPAGAACKATPHPNAQPRFVDPPGVEPGHSTCRAEWRPVAQAR